MQNIYVVLTWPTYYSIGNVQLAFGQASVERRSMILTQVRSIQPASTLFVFQRDKSTRLTAGSFEPYGSAEITDLTVCFSSCHSLLHLELSGDEGIRTPDLRRAKAALSQLSYIPDVPGFRWAFQDSNLRPRPYQRRALTN